MKDESCFLGIGKNEELIIRSCINTTFKTMLVFVILTNYTACFIPERMA